MVALEVLSGVFTPVWHLFTDVDVPGLGVSFGSFFLAVIIARLSVALVRHVFGFGGGTGYRSGTSRNVKISDERKGDEF